MRGWLEPWGPEDERTYWVRRGVVVAVALLLIVAVGWAGAALTRREPAPDTAATTATGMATPGAATPWGSSSTAPSPAAPVSTPEASTPAPTPAAPTPPTAAPVTPTPAGPSSPATPAGPLACDPSALRLTVAGAPRVKSGADEALTLSVINGGKQACVLDLSAKSYELKVTSGSDLIWTTAHCGPWVPAVKKTLKPEEAHEWTTTWNTRRSGPECQTKQDVLRPGTYVARAHFGAKASDGLVIILEG